MSGICLLSTNSTKQSKAFALGHIYGHIWDYIFENHLQGEWRHILCIQWCTFVSQRWIQLSGGQNLLALLQPISSTRWVRYVEGALTACLFWEWVCTTRSPGSFQAASPLLPYKEIIYKFNLLSGSLLVATKAVPYVDTSCDYNNAWMSMSKVAVHCTSTQSLHCKTRNEVFKSFSSY